MIKTIKYSLLPAIGVAAILTFSIPIITSSPAYADKTKECEKEAKEGARAGNSTVGSAAKSGASAKVKAGVADEVLDAESGNIDDIAKVGAAKGAKENRDEMDATYDILFNECMSRQ